MNIAFAGTPAFAAGHLAALIASHHDIRLVITQPDKPGKRGKKLVPSNVKKLALEHDIEVIQPEKLTAADLEAYDIDLMVVVAYGQILRQPVLEYPPLGCINVHASVLPRWRGAAPIQRAILAGDTASGVTIIQMDAGLDTGDMLGIADVSITDSDTSQSLEAKLLGAGPGVLLTVIDQLAAGTAKPVAQADGDTYATIYAKKITKEEALINWQASAHEVARQIRGFNPDPVAYSFLGDMRVKFWMAKASAKSSSATPGTVLEVTKDGVSIACGDGAITCNAMQLPVGKGSVLTGQDILNARADLVHPGALFTAN